MRWKPGYWLYGLAILALLGAAGIALALWFGIANRDYPVAVRSDAPPEFDLRPSAVVTSVSVPIGEVRQRLERSLPRTLVKVDREIENCVPRETVRILGRDVVRTPRIGCNLVGEVRRGPIALSGRGRTLRATVPVAIDIEVRDVGGIIERQRANATATVEVAALLSVSSDWRLKSDIRLGYRWREEPGFVVAGQRITFTSAADAEIAKILGPIEQRLEAEIGKVDLRSEVAGAWESGFAAIPINREVPPIWLRLSPRSAGTGELRVADRQVAVDLMLEAEVELFVGEQPPAPPMTPLGANVGILRERGFEISVPVLADYREVEPLILRGLRRLAAKGIRIEGIGAVAVDFEEVTLYATEGGRLAVGIKAEAAPVGSFTSSFWGRTRGTVWVTARPISAPDSQIIRVSDLEIFGDMDTSVGDLLLLVAQSEEVKAEIERGLVEDFQQDYERLIAKTRAGMGSVKVGGFDLSFAIEEISHAEIQATGRGLFMPVWATGTVTTRIAR